MAFWILDWLGLGRFLCEWGGAPFVRAAWRRTADGGGNSAALPVFPPSPLPPPPHTPPTTTTTTATSAMDYSFSHRIEMPLPASTTPFAAWCTGEIERSAALTSHTATASNHTSGAWPSPNCSCCWGLVWCSVFGGRCVVVSVVFLYLRFAFPPRSKTKQSAPQNPTKPSNPTSNPKFKPLK